MAVLREIWESEESVKRVQSIYRAATDLRSGNKALRGNEFIVEIYVFHCMTACGVTDFGSELCPVIRFYVCSANRHGLSTDQMEGNSSPPIECLPSARPSIRAELRSLIIDL
jgi:hypothetical protein